MSSCLGTLPSSEEGGFRGEPARHTLSPPIGTAVGDGEGHRAGRELHQPHTSKADTVRSYLKDKQNIDVKAVRPRGIILAGNASAFGTAKERDDFRLLAQGIKNLTVVTYDELLERLKNFINVLEEFGKREAAA